MQSSGRGTRVKASARHIAWVAAALVDRPQWVLLAWTNLKSLESESEDWIRLVIGLVLGWIRWSVWLHSLCIYPCVVNFLGWCLGLCSALLMFGTLSQVLRVLSFGCCWFFKVTGNTQSKKPSNPQVVLFVFCPSTSAKPILLYWTSFVPCLGKEILQSLATVAFLKRKWFTHIHTKNIARRMCLRIPVTPFYFWKISAPFFSE